jgi:hypothetical protein
MYDFLTNVLFPSVPKIPCTSEMYEFLIYICSKNSVGKRTKRRDKNFCYACVIDSCINCRHLFPSVPKIPRASEMYEFLTYICFQKFSRKNYKMQRREHMFFLRHRFLRKLPSPSVPKIPRASEILICQHHVASCFSRVNISHNNAAKLDHTQTTIIQSNTNAAATTTTKVSTTATVAATATAAATAAAPATTAAANAAANASTTALQQPPPPPLSPLP